MRKLEFSIAVKPFGEAAKKDATKFTKELKDQDTAVTRLAKNTTKLLDGNRFAFKSVEDSARKATDVITSGFERAHRVVDRFNDKIKDKTRETFRSIKDQFKLAFGVFAGEHLIEKAFELPKRLVEAGRSDINARMRARREFGADAGFMQERARLLGRNAGLDDAAAMNALFSIGEAVSGTQAGISFRGKKLNGTQADSLRKQTFGFGAGLLERILTVTHAQGDEATGIAEALANAGTGPEGMRGLVSFLHLNRAFSAEALKANEKGKLADLIGPALSKQFGVQRGKVAGQGTLVDILLSKSGITDAAAKEERSKFDFQIKSIGASFESVLGEIGSKALDKVDNGFAKGTTLAEKFQKILESPKGRDTIEHIADSLARGAESAIKLATKIPEAFGWLERHKGAIEVVAGIYAGLSVGKPIINAAKGAAGFLGLSRGSSPAAPLFVSVTNGAAGSGGTGGVAGKAIPLIGAGLAAEAAINHTLGKVNMGGGLKWADVTNSFGVFDKNKAAEAIRAQRQALLDKFKAENAAKAASDVAASSGSSPDPAAPSVQHISLHVDGKKMAEVVNDHNARKIKNASAGIPQ